MDFKPFKASMMEELYNTVCEYIVVKLKNGKELQVNVSYSPLTRTLVFLTDDYSYSPIYPDNVSHYYIVEYGVIVADPFGDDLKQFESILTCRGITFTTTYVEGNESTFYYDVIEYTVPKKYEDDVQNILDNLQ